VDAGQEMSEHSFQQLSDIRHQTSDHQTEIMNLSLIHKDIVSWVGWIDAEACDRLRCGVSSIMESGV
jgi:hypothetical protein